MAVPELTCISPFVCLLAIGPAALTAYLELYVFPVDTAVPDSDRLPRFANSQVTSSLSIDRCRRVRPRNWKRGDPFGVVRPRKLVPPPSGAPGPLVCSVHCAGLSPHARRRAVP